MVGWMVWYESTLSEDFSLALLLASCVPLVFLWVLVSSLFPICLSSCILLFLCACAIFSSGLCCCGSGCSEPRVWVVGWKIRVREIA